MPSQPLPWNFMPSEIQTILGEQEYELFKQEKALAQQARQCPKSEPNSEASEISQKVAKMNNNNDMVCLIIYLSDR